VGVWLSLVTVSSDTFDVQILAVVTQTIHPCEGHTDGRYLSACGLGGCSDARRDPGRAAGPKMRAILTAPIARGMFHAVRWNPSGLRPMWSGFSLGALEPLVEMF